MKRFDWKQSLKPCTTTFYGKAALIEVSNPKQLPSAFTQNDFGKILQNLYSNTCA